MSFDPLLTVLGLTALATSTTPTTYEPTATRAAVRIAPAALPSSPGIGDLAVDSGDTNKLKWWDGASWQTAGGGGGGTPAGADTQIQYNNSGVFGASSSFTYSAALGRVSITRTTDLANSIAFYITKTAPAAGATAGNYYGMYSNLTHSPNVGETNALILRPVYSEAVRQGSNASSIPSYTLIGGGFAAKNEGTAGTIGGATGVSAQVSTSAGTTTTDVTALSAFTSLSGASTTVKGINVAINGSGTLTTVHGVYIDVSSPANVTNRYGIYQVGIAPQNFFDGTMTVGSTSISVAATVTKLTATCNASFSDNTRTITGAQLTGSSSATGATATCVGALCQGILTGSPTSAVVTGLRGVAGSVAALSNSGTATPISLARGVSGEFSFLPSNASGTQTVTSVQLLYAKATVANQSFGSSTITTLYGLYLDTPTLTGTFVPTIGTRYGIYQADPLASNYFAGDVRVETAGKGFFVKEGSNAKMGTATLNNGSVTVSTTAVSATSRIFLCTQSPSGTSGALRVNSRVAGTSFAISSTSNTDDSVVAWIIIDPA